MAVTTANPSATNNPQDWDEKTRRAMLATGVLFIITFVTSIPALLLYGPILNNSDYVLTAGHDTRITFGALLEIALVVANAGSAITLYPVMKRRTEAVAIGYVASRLFESVMIALGLIALLSVVTLRQDFGGANAADSASIVSSARALVAVHDWTFLIGPAFCAGFGNGILLGYMMFKTGLMPRRLALLGMFGGSMAVGTAVAVLLGAYEQTSAISFFFTVPEIIWESIIGIFLTVRALKLGRERNRSGSAQAATGEPATTGQTAAA
ncbi:MAG: DUF4386 domain-containing protein [bacterium]